MSAASIQDQILQHPIVIVSTALYGDPRADEPLANAWQRARSRLGLSGEPEFMLIDRLRARVIQGLPGANEAEKIAYGLASGPDWLRRRHVRSYCQEARPRSLPDDRPETYLQ